MQQFEPQFLLPFIELIKKNARYSQGLFTWREEDPSPRKIREGGKTFRLLYMQNFGRSGYQVEKEKKNNYQP